MMVGDCVGVAWNVACTDLETAIANGRNALQYLDQKKVTCPTENPD